MASAAVALLLGGMIVPAATIEGEDGRSLIDDLVAQFEDTVDQASQDVTLMPLRPVDAYGRTERGDITAWTILVRATGDVALDDAVLLIGLETVRAELRAVRDTDGSLDAGRANAGDLIRLEVELPSAMGPGDVLDAFLDVPGARSATWTVTAPHNTARELVQLRLEAQTH